VTVAEETWRDSRLKRLQVSVISGVLYPIFSLLGRTYRWRIEGRDHLDALTAAGQVGITGWLAPAQGCSGAAVLRGNGAPVTKSLLLLFVSVQPLPLRSTAVVLLGAGVAPDPSKKLAL